MTRFVVVSDTHNMHDKVHVPAGDVLLHCGDFTVRGEAREFIDFNAWLGKQPHELKLVIGGNHDLLFDTDRGLAKSLLSNATAVLGHESFEALGLKFFGSPYSLAFSRIWSAYTYQPENAVRLWAFIPKNTDVLITHGPPFGIMDACRRPAGKRVGCPDLLLRALSVRPRIHCFGHVHEAAGLERLSDMTFINAAVGDTLNAVGGASATVIDL